MLIYPFTKIKKCRIVIDIPYGNYSPDWAIIHKVDDLAAKLYFIVETKCDKEKKDLTQVEDAKINCAKKHFAKVSEDITFDWVNSYNKFQELVQKDILRRRNS